MTMAGRRLAHTFPIDFNEDLRRRAADLNPFGIGGPFKRQGHVALSATEAALTVHLRQRLLHVLDMRRCIVQQALALSQVSAQSRHFGLWPKAGALQPIFVKTPQPLRVTDVGLPPWHVLRVPATVPIISMAIVIVARRSKSLRLILGNSLLLIAPVCGRPATPSRLAPNQLGVRIQVAPGSEP